ncbi:hypothetical protein EES45_20685 [Streptomyces sp. ADI97-07]|nr:hypothetical protein EES45_20685 [Streptomyces sp. ADI97-07]
MNDWKLSTPLRTVAVKFPKGTLRLLRIMAAVNSCAHVPVVPVETVWDLRPDCVPGPKTPLAVPSAMPSSNWIAYSMDLATSRE